MVVVYILGLSDSNMENAACNMQSNVCMRMHFQRVHLMPFQLCLQPRFCQKKFAQLNTLKIFVCVRFLCSSSDNKKFYHIGQIFCNLNRVLDLVSMIFALSLQ